MATLSSLKSERRILRAQVQENYELYDKINALYIQLRCTKEQHRSALYTTKNHHKRKLYWKGPSHNVYEALYSHFQTMEQIDLDKYNQAIDIAKKKLDLINSKNEFLQDEIDDLTYRINNWDD